ncbi:hypothetical protein N231010_081 [Synechococcus phage S-CAM4]|uniref:Uncharacterized protein n=1 Tax=Synechococcus phage S-CAM4 TaxID=1883367 RepID=A0A1D8KMG7_9CAUD|nr:hypothetical protein N231010_081 [Synechococcus phage S-CAM4]
MISKVTPPTFTVVGTVAPPMGAAGYRQLPSVLGVSSVSGPAKNATILSSQPVVNLS